MLPPHPKINTKNQSESKRLELNMRRKNMKSDQKKQGYMKRNQYLLRSKPARRRKERGKVRGTKKRCMSRSQWFIRNKCMLVKGNLIIRIFNKSLIVMLNSSTKRMTMGGKIRIDNMNRWMNHRTK
jgi:hypothetical protein